MIINGLSNKNGIGITWIGSRYYDSDGARIQSLIDTLELKGSSYGAVDDMKTENGYVLVANIVLLKSASTSNRIKSFPWKHIEIDTKPSTTYGYYKRL